MFVDLQNLEVVPLFGDMQIAPFFYIKKTPNYDPSKWPLCNSPAVSAQSNLLVHMETMREEHSRYISELARHSNEVSGLIELEQNGCKLWKKI